MRENDTAAFPTLDFNGHQLVCRESGMTLRDWFAGQALVAMAEMYRGQAMDPINTARSAYIVADAMIEARK